MFSLGAPPSAFAFDPKDPAVIYAATAALWRSEDAGRTWTMVYPDPGEEHGRPRLDRPRGLRDHDRRPRLRGERARRGHPRGRRRSPRTRGHLVMAVNSADSPRPGSPAAPTRLLASSDRGRTWTRLGELRHRARVRHRHRGRRGGAGRSGRWPSRASTRRRAEAGSASTRPRRAASSAASFGHDAASRRTPALRDDAGRGGSLGTGRAASASPRTADTPGARANGALLGASSGFGEGRGLGRMRRARGRAWGRSRRRRSRASWPTRACAGSGGAPTGRSSTASRRPWTAAAPGPSSTRRPTARPPTSSARGSRSARPDRRLLDLVRRALRPGGGAHRSRRLLRDRPLPHLPDAATAARPGPR